MSAKLAALGFGTATGLIVAWARLTDPAVIRAMLLMREADVMLLMGSAVVVAAIGVRMLRATRRRALLTGEPIGWSLERPEPRHVTGSALFGAGWCAAGTCPGPAAAMIGEGRFAGLVVVAGICAGVALQAALARRRGAHGVRAELPGAAGL